jgi:hypothetical protein
MKFNLKSIVAFVTFLFLGAALTACSSQADTVNKNLDKEAEQFKVYRQVSFINGITDQEIQRVQGFCNLEYGGAKIDVTCKEKGKFYRNTLTESDNSFVSIQQLQPSEVSDTRYKFVVRPGSLIPDVDIK